MLTLGLHTNTGGQRSCTARIPRRARAARRTRVVTVLSGLVVTVVGTAIVVILLARDWKTIERGETAVMAAPQGFVPQQPPMDIVERRRPEPVLGADGSGWDDVSRLCQGLVEPLTYRLSARGGFTVECERALDWQFLDTPPTDVPLTARDGSLTWREVFASPEESRRKAEEAIGRRCANVERDCDLNALAAFAVLKYQCGGRRYGMLDGIGPGIHEGVERAGLDHLADNMVYWRRREEVERAYYRTAWLAAKCAALPQGALASFVPEGRTWAFPLSDPRIPPKLRNVTSVGHDPEPGQEGWWWAEQAWEAYQLMSRAFAMDRRGTGQLMVTAYEYGHPKTGSWQSRDPLMAEIVELKRWASLFEWEKNRQKRLNHAYLAATWASTQGLHLDRGWLFAQVGRPVSEREWEGARLRAEQMLRTQGWQVLFADEPSDDS